MKYRIYTGVKEVDHIGNYCKTQGWNYNGFMTAKDKARRDCKKKGLQFTHFYYKENLIGVK